ncbi:hypothetical protein N2152v2_005550 [Parachlorella kessleri]
MLSNVQGLLRGLPLALARGVAASTVPALRAFSSRTSKALVIDEFGPPADVLHLEHQTLREPGEGEAPINPSDMNTIEGKYPLRPDLPGVPGHEGMGVVEAVGPRVDRLKVGDMVIPVQQSQGTWRSHGIFPERFWHRIPKDLPVATAATMVVNPPTALRLLEEFVTLEAGDTVIQNGANSAVGKVIIQVARSRGINTINVIRDRPDRVEVEGELKELGATLVTTPAELKRDLAGSGLTAPRLALDCVAGEAALAIAKTLEEGGTMVTYGGMSMQPIPVPAPILIFKDIRLRGFWLTGGFAKMKDGWKQKENLVDRVVALYRQKAIKPPLVECVPLERWQEAMDLYHRDQRNYKVLLTNYPDDVCL